MRTVVLAIAALAAAQPAAAVAPTCPSLQRGTYPPTYTLVMAQPVAGRTVLAKPDVVAGKGAVLAQQTITVAPVQRYLASDVKLTDEKGAAIANAVPLAAGSQITVWRGLDGERNCSIGWRNGLFGGATGEGHYRWVCFDDKDGDGAYENAWLPRTKNLGLTFSRLDMPISPPVRWTADTPGATMPAARQTGLLGGQKLSRRIEVRAANGREIRLEYSGPGVPRDKASRAVLKAREAGSVTLGGVTIALTPVPDGWARVTATGEFDPLPFEVLCDGSYRIGEQLTSISFAFPNW